MRFHDNTNDDGGEAGPGHRRGHRFHRHDPGQGRPDMAEGRRPHRGPGGRSGRAQRGDVRTAVLLLLADEAMHGYQLMQAIADRTEGAWRPSPGAVYPTISQLEDEGLVTVTAQGGRKLVTMTPAGSAYLAENRAALPDPFTAATAQGGGDNDLRGPLHELHGATRQIAMSGTPADIQAARRILSDARRALYLILAGGSPASPGE